jgi:predicted lipoprotein with Yx(FWY)xxD motif
MKRTLITLVAAAAIALTASASADASHGAPTLVLRHTSIGTLLTDSRGFTLYEFTRDMRDRDTCVRISGCAAVWPPLTTAGSPVAGVGLKPSLLGTIAVDGRRQVTYAGHPLYTYVGDGAPGQTDYVGVAQFGGSWPALSAAGTPVR